MQSCHTVDRVAGDDCHICHLHLSVIDDRHLADLLLYIHAGYIAVLLLNVDDESAVDLFHDLVDSRKQSGEQFDGPFLQCFRHDGVVGVSTGLGGDLPRFLPGQIIIIHQHTHQFCDRYGRMGIVQLEGNLLIELMDIVMLSHVLLYCFLYGCGDEEVLLLQTQLLTCIMIVIGVQNLYDITCQVLLLYRLLVITLVKGIQLEALYGLRIPDTQGVYNAIAITHNREIKRNGLNGLITLLGKYISAVLIGMHTYIATEFNRFRILRSAQFKRIAIHQPVIGNLYLIAVADLLLEHTITITDTAAVCGISKSRQGIQEACCQTSQSTVTQRCIRLLILDQVQIQSQLFQSFRYGLVCL